MKDYPRVLTIQDLSCLGQCSAAVALPILSACGCEACLLPTMVLSTHTGGLGVPARMELTRQLLPICEHWCSQGLTFDGIYVGYLGSARQVALVQEMIPKLLAPGGLVIVDPAMADHGKLYSGLDEAYAAEMAKLCGQADVMLPNMTEACMLCSVPYEPQADAWAMVEKLHSVYKNSVVLTGVSRQPGEIGGAVFEKGEIFYTSHEELPGSYHGTGDMFASVLVGQLLRGASLVQAAEKAGDFVHRAIEKTLESPAHGYGVKFEKVLSILWE